MGIQLLPAQLPMEVLMWAYPDVKIGGYSSSLYMSTALEQTIFFITDSKYDLVSPLPELYELGHFGDAKFFKVTEEESELSVTASHKGRNIPLTVTDSVYSANVSNVVDQLELTIVPHNKASEITVEKDGTPVPLVSHNDKYTSEPISLRVGENKIEIKEKAASLESITHVVITRESRPRNPGGGGGIIGAPSTSESTTISGGVSGTASFQDSVELIIPEGALEETATFVIEKVTDSDSTVSDKASLLSDIYELTKSTSESFAEKVELRVQFDKGKLKDGQIPEVFHYNEDLKEWISLGGKVEGDWIKVSIDHLGKFAVFAVDSDQTGEPGKPEIRFSDTTGHWAQNKITEAIAKGIISGYPDGTFRPDQSVSRQEFTLMLADALQLSEASETPAFEDWLSIGNWARQAVSNAVKAGIVSGYEDGTFRPSDFINRAEMTTMIMRAVHGQMEQANSATSFADDQEIPSWAQSYVAAAVQQRMIEGRENNTFVPYDNTTRAEAVVIILRALEASE